MQMPQRFSEARWNAIVPTWRPTFPADAESYHLSREVAVQLEALEGHPDVLVRAEDFVRSEVLDDPFEELTKLVPTGRG